MGFARGSWLPTAAALVGACATTPSTNRPIGSQVESPATAAVLAPIPARAPARAPGGVEIQAEHGSLDREDVEEAVEPHFQKLSRCFEDAQLARDFASGQVTLRFVVGLDGGTSTVHVRSSDLGSYEVERCLVAVASRIRFARPKGYGVASFEYSLEFRSTGAIPVVQLAPDALSASMPIIFDRLTQDCGGLGNAELRATLYIDRRGQVRSVGFGSPGPLPDERGACLVRSLRRESLTVSVQGDALGRIGIALRQADVVAAVRPSEPAPRTRRERAVQGRRRPRGR
jgi:hypothetical protein